MSKNKWKQAQGDKTFIYQLNDKGTNYFWLKVQSARTKDEANQEELEKIGDLIAAAPELLEALEEVRKVIADQFPYSYEAGDFDYITKAIAKAKGESNV